MDWLRETPTVYKSLAVLFVVACAVYARGLPAWISEVPAAACDGLVLIVATIFEGIVAAKSSSIIMFLPNWLALVLSLFVVATYVEPLVDTAISQANKDRNLEHEVACLLGAVWTVASSRWPILFDLKLLTGRCGASVLCFALCREAATGKPDGVISAFWCSIYFSGTLVVRLMVPCLPPLFGLPSPFGLHVDVFCIIAANVFMLLLALLMPGSRGWVLDLPASIYGMIPAADSEQRLNRFICIIAIIVEGLWAVTLSDELSFCSLIMFAPNWFALVLVPFAIAQAAVMFADSEPHYLQLVLGILLGQIWTVASFRWNFLFELRLLAGRAFFSGFCYEIVTGKQASFLWAALHCSATLAVRLFVWWLRPPLFDLHVDVFCIFVSTMFLPLAAMLSPRSRKWLRRNARETLRRSDDWLRTQYAR